METVVGLHGDYEEMSAILLVRCGKNLLRCPKIWWRCEFAMSDCDDLGVKWEMLILKCLKFVARCEQK